MEDAPATDRIAELIERWDGVGVLVSFDRPTGTWIFICLHDDRLGPCTGGTRMKVYARREDGLRDGLRLAGAMTRKWAGLGRSFGGGKAVLALARPLEGEDRRGLLRRYGRLVNRLRGSFLTGEDLGTTTEDLRLVAEETDSVQGFDPASGEKVDPSPYTARGVYQGVCAGLEAVFGSPDCRGRTVLVQGAGSVGWHLCELLAKAGAELLVSDLDSERVNRAVEGLGATAVPPAEDVSTPCDVFAPCAVGEIVNPDTVGVLACRIVAGSANNQLSSGADADALHRRGILYLPDYIVNAGGALSFALMTEGQAAGDALMTRIDEIGSILAAILAEASERGETPLAAAQRRVERRLAAAGDRSGTA